MLIIGILWLIFWVVWFVSALGAKRDIRTGGSWLTGFSGRLMLFVIIIFIFNSPYFRAYYVNYTYWPLSPATDRALIDVGVALVAIGIAFAFWARFYLGRNWSGRPSIKVNHELVTGGPYKYVRHPIYTGMLVAIIGTVLGEGPVWILILLGFMVMVFFRIPKEEGFMTELFPDQYPAYKAKTKDLIPFVW